MGFLKAVGKFFAFWTKASNRYVRLKDDEGQRETSQTLGVRSIVRTLTGVVLFVALVWLLVACIGNFRSVQSGSGGSLPILSIIGIVFGAVGALAAFVQGVLGGLIYLIYQFKLNRRPVRWIALSVWLLSLIGMVVFAACMLAGL